MAIETLTGDYDFLSNMYPLSPGLFLLPEGINVPTVEHAYQTAKFIQPNVRKLVISAATGHLAKRESRRLAQDGALIVPNWSEIKIAVMTRAVEAKFNQYPKLAERLLATGEEEIVEGNDWGDRFWGVTPPYTRKGANHLGIILMDVRAQLGGVGVAGEGLEL